MTQIDDIKLKIATQLMHDSGWREENRERDSIEWDLNRDDSQFYMMLENTSEVIDYFLEHLSDVEDEQEEEKEEEESLFDEWGHIRRKQTNTTTATLYVFMDAGTGNPRYVSDVREWLTNIDRLGVPDTEEVEGFLHLCHDIELDNVEKIECLECENKDDLLLTAHKCKTGE